MINKEATALPYTQLILLSIGFAWVFCRAMTDPALRRYLAASWYALGLTCVISLSAFFVICLHPVCSRIKPSPAGELGAAIIVDPADNQNDGIKVLRASEPISVVGLVQPATNPFKGQAVILGRSLFSASSCTGIMEEPRLFYEADNVPFRDIRQKAHSKKDHEAQYASILS